MAPVDDLALNFGPGIAAAARFEGARPDLPGAGEIRPALWDGPEPPSSDGLIPGVRVFARGEPEGPMR